MRIFKTNFFHRWTKRVGVDNSVLRKAIEELIQGQYEAKLGGYLYKKRIAFCGRGKSGGLRTIIAFRREDKIFFIYGFSKNEKENIDQHELRMYKKLAKSLFLYNEQQIQYALKNQDLIKV